MGRDRRGAVPSGRFADSAGRAQGEAGGRLRWPDVLTACGKSLLSSRPRRDVRELWPRAVDRRRRWLRGNRRSAGRGCVGARKAVKPRSQVSAWCEGLGPSALPVDHHRVLAVLADRHRFRQGPLTCQEMAAAGRRGSRRRPRTAPRRRAAATRRQTTAQPMLTTAWRMSSRVSRRICTAQNPRSRATVPATTRCARRGRCRCWSRATPRPPLKVEHCYGDPHRPLADFLTIRRTGNPENSTALVPIVLQ